MRLKKTKINRRRFFSYVHKKISTFGFTLIELLVVISVIALISTAAVYMINHNRAVARDTKRVADLEQIRKALELYYDENGSYPPLENDVSGECIGDQDSAGNDKSGVSVCGNAKLFEKQIAKYLINAPADPKHNYSCWPSCSTPANNYYFYSYDPKHLCPDCSTFNCTTLCFNKSESKKYSASKNNPFYTCGDDMGQDYADYCLVLNRN